MNRTSPDHADLSASQAPNWSRSEGTPTFLHEQNQTRQAMARLTGRSAEEMEWPVERHDD